MATDLFWEPVAPTSARALPRALKYIVCRHWFNHDGSLGGDKRELTAEDIPYLLGVRDAGENEVKIGAQTLIDAIEQYGTIEITTRA